jgi:hypothetical protein
MADDGVAPEPLEDDTAALDGDEPDEDDTLVLEDGLDFCDETYAERLERDRDGWIVSHRVPVWFPPLKSFLPAPTLTRPPTRPAGARRAPRQRTRRVARTTGARGDPDDPSPRRHLRVISPERFRRDVDAWLEAAGR